MNSRQDFINSYLPTYRKFFPTVTVEEIGAFYDESKYVGYPDEPGGSVWTSEGKSIYVLIRLLKPKRILEIGNYLGVSTNHILQAVEKNGNGEVVLVDIKEFLQYDKLHNRNFYRIIQDSTKYLAEVDLDFDLYIQDGCHEYNIVSKELELITTRTKNSFHIWGHDWFHTDKDYIKVREAWTDNGNIDHAACKDSVSNCGFVLGYFKK